LFPNTLLALLPANVELFPPLQMPTAPDYVSFKVQFSPASKAVSFSPVIFNVI